MLYSDRQRLGCK